MTRKKNVMNIYYSNCSRYRIPYSDNKEYAVERRYVLNAVSLIYVGKRYVLSHLKYLSMLVS